MIYPSIRIEGQIFSGELLAKLEQSDTPGQRPADFALARDTKVKNEIAAAWASAQSFYRAFRTKTESRNPNLASRNPQPESAFSSQREIFPNSNLGDFAPLRENTPASLTPETRNLWLIPLLSLLGYTPVFARKGEDVNGKLFSISHRDENHDALPLHLLGWNDSLDKRRDDGSGPRMSPHALLQEYLNLTEHLYGIVANGRTLRLLRDSTRLVRQSFIEFDLERMFDEDLFADFAVLYRLLHATRLPAKQTDAATSLIETYHQDALDQGARIRDGLSEAVKSALTGFINGFISHPENDRLRTEIAEGRLNADTLYGQSLRLIYRLLFLLVIEERHLVFPEKTDPRHRETYYRYYSLQRIRRLAEKPPVGDRRPRDLWLSLLSTFRLYEAGGPGAKLSVAPLAGDLFSPNALGLLTISALDNGTLLAGLRAMCLYRHPETRQLIRVNYASLNVEEFGSVYEKLLKFIPVLKTTDGTTTFSLQPGPDDTQSHYTPDELVQPLIHHSLDHLIAAKLAEAREMANSEWRMVNGEYRKAFYEYANQRLSGSGRVAARADNCQAGVRIDKNISEGRAIRDDIANTESGNLHSGEHCRGLGTSLSSGVHAISSDSQRQPDGTGNAPDHKCRCGAMPGGIHSPTSGANHDSGKTASGTGTQSVEEVNSEWRIANSGEEANSERRMANSGNANSEWRIANRDHSPLTTHHSHPSDHSPPPDHSPPLEVLWTKTPFATRHSLFAAQALLRLRVADISCGSGHILLAAARRIATELAVIRTGEEQPSPTAFRAAVRDVITHCIYGVDLNPLAVDLCKVALWLEAHNPGQPLNFLDHHIKCGNAIVGYARREEAERGVPDEAFKTLSDDDKTIAAALRKRNKDERADHQKRQQQLDFSPAANEHLAAVLRNWREVAGLPEKTPEQISEKKQRYEQFVATADAALLKQILAIPIAQFYIPKTEAKKCITDAGFREYWSGRRHPQGEATALAWATAAKKRFFHWFLEFPEIFADPSTTRSHTPTHPHTLHSQEPGFDLILGNPPYKGDKHLSGLYGQPFCEYVKWEYAPAGLSDLVVYFVRRIYTLLRPGGFTAFITTNSIKDGDIRKDGLEQVVAQGGSINMAVRGIKWPGAANLVVSLVALHKGDWQGPRALDGQSVETINAFFEDAEVSGEPVNLFTNANLIFTGYHFWGDGFLLTKEQTKRLLSDNPRNSHVIFPIINGDDVNNLPDQQPIRDIINFRDWNLDQAAEYHEPFSIVEQLVKPFRETKNRERTRRLWWQYAEVRPGMRRAIEKHRLERCFVSARTTKHLNFSCVNASLIFSDALNVFTTDRWELYAVVQSTIHEIWARKYSGALETRLRYSPSDCFDTFPFPAGLLDDNFSAPQRPSASPASPHTPALADIGEQYHELRRLHIQLDNTVLSAYGWSPDASPLSASAPLRENTPCHPPITLDHAFTDIETLPENDRTRYTLSAPTRKALLTRLLAENHHRATHQPPTTKPTKNPKPPAAAKENRPDYAQKELGL